MFLGKTLEVSLSATKRAASKKMCDLLSQLLSNIEVIMNISCGYIGIISYPNFISISL